MHYYYYYPTQLGLMMCHSLNKYHCDCSLFKVSSLFVIVGLQALFVENALSKSMLNMQITLS